MMKLKKTVKDIQQSGISKWDDKVMLVEVKFLYHNNENLQINSYPHCRSCWPWKRAFQSLDKMGDTAITRDDESDDIEATFQKFAVATKELGGPMRNLVCPISMLMIYMF